MAHLRADVRRHSLAVHQEPRPFVRCSPLELRAGLPLPVALVVAALQLRLTLQLRPATAERDPHDGNCEKDDPDADQHHSERACFGVGRVADRNVVARINQHEPDQPDDDGDSTEEHGRPGVPEGPIHESIMAFVE
jgi:hypothetical protein